MNFPIYILAEGKSSRMGSDKGLVKINGEEMMLHCIENQTGLKYRTLDITIITSNREYEKFGYRIISDKIKNQGPAQGILTAMDDAKADKCLIVSCDMPLITYSVIRLLFDLPRNTEIACFQKEFLFPFPGLYSKSILPKWKKKVDEGNLKMQWLIKQFDYKTLPIEHPELFLNVNTPEDILQVEKILNT